MWRRVVVVTSLAAAACGTKSAGHEGDHRLDGGLDDASIPSFDAPPGPPDAPPDAPPADATALVLETPTSTIGANGHTKHAVTVRGEPLDSVELAVAPPTAGHVATAVVQLDATGFATAAFIPCAAADTGCLGDASITAAYAAADPSASLAISLVAPSEISTIDPCLTGGNVLYLDGDGFPGSFLTTPAAAFTATPSPDQIQIAVTDTTSITSVFSTLSQFVPVQPGTFSGGVNVGGCASPAGTFQVHDYTADDLGRVSSATISFEQTCDGSPALVEGCVHFEQTLDPIEPVVIPPPGPGEVVITSRFRSTNSIAIFTDPFGTVVFDGPVDANGVARALLPLGGEVTVIEDSILDNHFIYTFRGVKPGDDLQVAPFVPPGISSRHDQMLVRSPPPDGSAPTQLRGCPSFNDETGVFDFGDLCRPSTFDLLTVSTPATGTPQYAWTTGIPHHAFGNVDIPADAWQPMAPATFAMTNAPAGSLVLGAWGAGVDGHPRFVSSGAFDTVGGTASGTLASTPSTTGGTFVRAEIEVTDTVVDSVSQFRLDSPASVTLDHDALPLPALSQFAETVGGATWTETGPRGNPDARVVFWHAAFGSPNRIVTWQVVEDPSGPSTFTLPALPASHADLDPRQNPPFFAGLGQVRYIDFDVVNGYDQLRARVFRLDPANRTTLESDFLAPPYLEHDVASPAQF